MRCGKVRHSKQNCPAEDSICYKCGKRGHFGTVCLSKTVAPVSKIPPEVDPIETSYLSAITDNNKPTKSWSVRVIVNGKVVPFVIDTGAEVSAISLEIYEVIGAPQLHRPKRVLCGPGRQTLDVRGCCTVKISHKHLNTIQTLYVIHNLNNNLLGLPAIIALNILTQVNTVCSTDNQIIKKLPTLFQGLRTIKDEYKIKLKPILLLEKFQFHCGRKSKNELQQMEATGVISKVDCPTDWCAGMVVVQKKSGGVCICVDLKPPNQNVLREAHPMPHVDDTLAQLSGATVFSKLDARSGFWQVPLKKSSRLLTTFITPFGQYYFNKLPFGISSAQEIFQRMMSRLLEGIPGFFATWTTSWYMGKTNKNTTTT